MVTVDTTTDSTTTITDSFRKVSLQLNQAHKKVAHLMEEIGRLSDDLRRKNLLLATLKFRRLEIVFFSCATVMDMQSSWLEIVFFPCATVMNVAEKISCVLECQPQVDRLIIHVGTNDKSRQQSRTGFFKTAF